MRKLCGNLAADMWTSVEKLVMTYFNHTIVPAAAQLSPLPVLIQNPVCTHFCTQAKSNFLQMSLHGCTHNPHALLLTTTKEN